MIVLILVSAAMAGVVLLVTDIVYTWLRRLRPLLLLLRLLPLRHWTRWRHHLLSWYRLQHLSVCTCEWCRLRPKLRLIRLQRSESLSLPESIHPTAVSAGVPSWFLSCLGMETTWLVQHAIKIPFRILTKLGRVIPFLLTDSLVPGILLLRCHPLGMELAEIGRAHV